MKRLNIAVSVLVLVALLFVLFERSSVMPAAAQSSCPVQVTDVQRYDPNQNEQTILDVTVPAGLVQPKGTIRGHIELNAYNASGAKNTYTFRWSVNGYLVSTWKAVNNSTNYETGVGTAPYHFSFSLTDTMHAISDFSYAALAYSEKPTKVITQTQWNVFQGPDLYVFSEDTTILWTVTASKPADGVFIIVTETVVDCPVSR
jgi:hypothetical protein